MDCQTLKRVPTKCRYSLTHLPTHSLVLKLNHLLCDDRDTLQHLAPPFTLLYCGDTSGPGEWHPDMSYWHWTSLLTDQRQPLPCIKTQMKTITISINIQFECDDVFRGEEPEEIKSLFVCVCIWSKAGIGGLRGRCWRQKFHRGPVHYPVEWQGAVATLETRN